MNGQQIEELVQEKNTLSAIGFFDYKIHTIKISSLLLTTHHFTFSQIYYLN